MNEANLTLLGIAIATAFVLWLWYLIDDQRPFERAAFDLSKRLLKSELSSRRVFLNLNRAHARKRAKQRRSV